MLTIEKQKLNNKRLILFHCNFVNKENNIFYLYFIHNLSESKQNMKIFLNYTLLKIAYIIKVYSDWANQRT